MIQTLRRTISVYGAFTLNIPKIFLAYSAWVWAELIVQLMSMVVFVYFWQAVYAGQSELRGLSLKQTLNYILLAQALLPLAIKRDILRFGEMLREGNIVLELLRPVDFQGRFYAEALGELIIDLAFKSPLIVFAVLVFDLSLPNDPLVWGAFVLSVCSVMRFCSVLTGRLTVWPSTPPRSGGLAF